MEVVYADWVGLTSIGVGWGYANGFKDKSDMGWSSTRRDL